MLTPLGESIWHAQSQIGLAPGIRLPLNMAVVRVGDGSLLLYSPIRIDDELATELAELGEVRYLVAPNTFHHLHLEAAQNRYPEAKTFGPSGLSDKTGAQLDAPLSEHPPIPLDGIRFLPIGGIPKLNEWVLIHEPSQTLVVSDLVFNIMDPPTWLTGLVNRLAGVYRRCGISRIFKTQIKDPEAFSNSIQALLELPFDRIAMAHGQLLPSGAKEVLRAEIAAYL